MRSTPNIWIEEYRTKDGPAPWSQLPVGENGGSFLFHRADGPIGVLAVVHDEIEQVMVCRHGDFPSVRDLTYLRGLWWQEHELVFLEVEDESRRRQDNVFWCHLVRKAGVNNWERGARFVHPAGAWFAKNPLADYPKVRDPMDINRAADITAKMAENETPFELGEADRSIARIIADTLCWVLDHPHQTALARMLENFQVELAQAGFVTRPEREATAEQLFTAEVERLKAQEQDRKEQRKKRRRR